MGFFKRIFTMGAAEANAALDKIEDPVKMTEQGIRDMKNDLNESLKGLAEVKAQAIRARKDLEAAKSEAAEYEQKAIMLIQRAETGQIDPAEADRLATEALNRKEQALQRATSQQQIVQTQEAAVSKMESNVQRLKSQIGHWENEAKTLKARAKVSQASTKLNKQLANIDSSSTVSMLERMKDKVAQQEALAESYGDMADTSRSVDEEIDKVLLGSGGTSTGGGSAQLEALKARLSAGKSGGGDSTAGA